MLIDTHSHLNFSCFKDDWKGVIQKCFESSISMINVGTNFETSKRAVEIAEKYSSGVFAAIGLHPINLDTGLMKRKNQKEKIKNWEDILEKEFDYQKYKKLAKNQKVVAIGEIGLDYYWKPKTTNRKILFKEKQKELLLQELKLAQELNLPVIFHCRVAHEDLIRVLNLQLTTNNLQLKGVMHGFVGTVEGLEKYLAMGFYIGFNGIIFKNIEGIDFVENIKRTPVNKILLETDCPYLTPPKFSEQRNNPMGVKLIAEHIAKIKKMSVGEIEKITTQNAKKLFGI